MYELRRLIKQSDPKVKQKAKGTGVVRFAARRDVTFGKDQFGPYYKMEWVARSAKAKKPHTCEMRFYDVVGTTGKVNCSCDCADFKYRWDYALFVRDSSDLEQATAQKPREKNPTVKGGLCKHLLTVEKILPRTKRFLRGKMKSEFRRG